MRECPLCGDRFNTSGPHGTVATTEPGLRRPICPQCTAERQIFAEMTIEQGGPPAEVKLDHPRSITHRFPAEPVPPS
jgi:hypothetical protein